MDLRTLVSSFKKILRQNVGRTVLLALAVVIYSVISQYLIENPIKTSGIHSLFQSLWWTMQTITTVGYGDVTIVGFYGKTNAMIIMVIGIGTFSLLLVTVAAEIVDAKLLKRLGRARTKMEEHSIVCNYTDKQSSIIKRLVDEKFPILILGNEESKEIADKGEFIRGNPLNVEDLKKAGIERAVSMIIFPNEKYGSDDSLALDAESILILLTARKLNKDLKITIELLNESSRVHADEAGADNVIVRGDLSSAAIISALTQPEAGMFLNKMVMSSGYFSISQNTFEKMSGKPYEEIIKMIIDEGGIPLSVYQNGQFTNPYEMKGISKGEIFIYLKKGQQQ
ncbi:ion channel [Cuniculiplasma sp. SKW3]|uniref:ion channel n=1 Tax=Cuniculiplasma sp. SKW3 TaxID=3400170 RepID=UPI003FD02FCB